jgi:hypothetical protein
MELLTVNHEEIAETEDLEEWADDYVTEVFTPLYLTDLFMLDRLKGNDAAYCNFMWALTDKWTVPDEEQKEVEADIQKYCPKQRKRRR